MACAVYGKLGWRLSESTCVPVATAHQNTRRCKSAQSIYTTIRILSYFFSTLRYISLKFGGIGTNAKAIPDRISVIGTAPS
jgi:hypothetical protein